MQNANALSPQGRTVFVSTPLVGGGFTPFKAYLIVIDDDDGAIEAVRKHLLQEGFDEHRFELAPVPLTRGSMAGVKLTAGEVLHWSTVSVRA